MRPKLFPLFATVRTNLLATLALSSLGYAATATKSATGTDLALGTSWSGGSGPGFPTSSDVATWNTSSLGTGLTAATAVNWGSIDISGATGAIGITGAGKITTGNITLAGNQILSIANPIALSGNSVFNIDDASSSPATDATLSGIISGAFGLTKSGAGTLTLSGINTFSGPLNLNSGAVTSSAASGAAGTGTFLGSVGTASAHKVINIASGAQMSYTSTTANSFLALGATPATGGYGAFYDFNISGTLAINDGAAVSQILQSTYNLQNGGVITNTGTAHTAAYGLLFGWTSAGGGNVNVTGTGNQITADQIGFFNGATITTNSGADLTITSIVKNGSTTAGSLTKSGAGSLVLTNANTFTGATRITSGVLVITNPSALGNSTLVWDNLGGTLDFGTVGTPLIAVTIGNLQGAQDLPMVNPASGRVNLTVGNTASTANSTYGGVLGGASFTKIGTSSLTLTGASSNTYGGDFTINTLGGTGGTSPYTSSSVYLGKTGGALAVLPNTKVIFGTGTTGMANLRMLQSNQFGVGVVMAHGNSPGNYTRFDLVGTSQTLAGSTSGNSTTTGGGIIQNVGLDGVGTGPGTLTLNGDATDSFYPAGGYVHNGWIRDTDAGANATKRLNIVKNGSGTQTFQSGNITYTGQTAINQGRLIVRDTGGAFDSSATSISAAAVLEFNASVSGNTLQLNNNGQTITGSGTLEKTGPGQLLFGANGQLVSISLGSGALIDVKDGTLRNEYAKGDWTANLADLNIGAAAKVDVWDSDITVDVLTGKGNVNEGLSATTNKTLIVGVDGGNGVFEGVLTNTSGTLNLAKAGTGTQILTGANTYKGVTTISGGTLQVGNGGTAGTLGSGAVINNAELKFDRSDSITVANAISGTGTVTQAGSGTLVLAGTITCGGGVSVTGGTLAVPANSGLKAAKLNLGAGSTLAISNFTPYALVPVEVTTLGGLSTTGTVNVSISGDLSNQGSYPLIYVPVGDTISKEVFNALSLTVPRSIDAKLENVEGGVYLEIDAINPVTWKGDVDNNWDIDSTLNWKLNANSVKYLQSDYVRFDDTSVNKTVALNVAVAPTSVTFDNSVGKDYLVGGSGAITGATGLTKTGSGKVTLTNTHTYTGGTTVDGGILELGDGTTNGSVAGDIADDANVTFNNGTAQTYAGVISGNGMFEKKGAGTLTLTGKSTYAGATLVSAGTLQVGSGGTSGTLDSGLITNNAALRFNRSDSFNVANDISGSGTVSQAGTGTLSISGDLSRFSGQFRNEAGNTRIQAPDANWANADIVLDTAGGWVEFGGGGTASVKSVSSTRDVNVNNGTRLDVGSGGIAMSTNAHVWKSDDGAPGELTSSTRTLTVSNGSLTGDNYETLDQRILARIVDFDATTPLTFVKNGANRLNLDQVNTYSGGTIIKGGLVNAVQNQALGSGPVRVDSGGAYLSAPNYTNDFLIKGNGPLSAGAALGAIRLHGGATLSGNVTVDSAGARITSNAGQTGTLAGALIGSGSLVINNTGAATGASGIVRFNGDSAGYSGNVSVEQGRLDIGAANFGGAVVVSNIAALGGEGVVAGAGGVNFAAGSTLAIDPSSPGMLAVNGPLTINGTIKVSPDGLFSAGAGPIKVVSFGSKGGGWNVSQFISDPSLRPGAKFTENGNTIEMSNPTLDLAWSNSTGNSTWNTNTDANFKNGQSDEKFYQGDRVAFGDLPGTAQTVTLAGNVRPGSIKVDSQYNYTFSEGSIDGATSLVKSGSGTLILNQTNTHTGGTTVNGGILVANAPNNTVGAGNVTVNNGGKIQVGGDNSFVGNPTSAAITITINAGGEISAPTASSCHLHAVVMNGGKLTATTPRGDYGSWNFDQGISTTGSGATSEISGGNASLSQTGGTHINVQGTDTLTISTALAQITQPDTGLVKGGAGTLQLSGDNTYGSGTTVNGGTLLANNSTGSATGTGAVVVNDTGRFGGSGSVTGSVTVNSGGALALDGAIESLATGSLTLAAGSTCNIEFNSKGTPRTDVVEVTGDVALAGSLNLTDLAGAPTAIAAGTKLTILTYSGTLTGAFAGLADGGTVTAGSQTFTIHYADNNTVTLEAETYATLPDPFGSWAANAGLDGTSGKESGPMDDPDQDGLSNLVEFYLDGDPLASDPASQPAASLDDTYFTIIFKRRDDAEAAVTSQAIAYGADLAAWSESVLGAESSTDPNGVIVTVDENGAAPDDITVRIPRNLEVGGKLFGRLKVSQ